MILITGDSWACGEWPQLYTGPECFSHKGLTQYLRNCGKSVINLGIPGGSNQDTVSALRRFFQSGVNQCLRDPLNAEHGQGVFVFQTEWYRDIFDINQNHRLSECVLDEHIHQNCISEFYHALSSIAKEFNVKIHLIGGSSDVIWLDDFSKEYPGVSVACQSLVNLCVNGSHRTDVEYLGGISTKAAEAFKSQVSNITMMTWLEQMIDQCVQRQVLLEQNPDYFWPDSKHANRKGHRRLFDFLLENEYIK